MAARTPVYLDYNATTPMDPRVFESMRPFFLERFGNASSRHHAFGCDAAKAVEHARRQVADLIGADPREIVFTSGATEAINLAIKGVAESTFYRSKGRHAITVATEHKAVLDTFAWLERKGWATSYLPVDHDGRISLDRLADVIRDDTVFVSIMHANNETGVLHPIEAIGQRCREKGTLFLCDATQSVGKEPVDVEVARIDLLSLSAHKIYGPKGAGALFVRRAKPRVRCEALLHGGGHERGLRSGTLNVPGIVGLGAAASICREEMSREQGRIRLLRDRLQEELVSRMAGVDVNGCPDYRLSNTLNVSFPGIDGDALMKQVSDIAVSSSSACTSAALQPSYVLGAMGRDDDAIAGSIRFSLGRFTTEEEISYAVDRFVAVTASMQDGCGR